MRLNMLSLYYRKFVALSMARQMVKPYSFLLYLLTIMSFFFIGILIAGLVGAGKGQMLAGGAIVLGYGVIGSITGFCLALFTTSMATRSTILKANGFLTISIFALIAWFTFKYQKRQQQKEQEKTEEQMQQKENTVPKGSPE